MPLLSALGLEARAVLRAAGLPEDWVHRPTTRMTLSQYRAFLTAMDALAPATLPLHIGRQTVSGTFHPVVFAALCSPDLRVAAGRVRDHTRLCVPKTLELVDTPEGFTLSWSWSPPAEGMPFSDGVTPLVFMVELARVATRTPVVPVSVVLEQAAPDPAYEAFFGVKAQLGPRTSVCFAAQDAGRPFLTANHEMWEVFAPELQRRVSQLEAGRSTAERVQGLLLECLPSGLCSAEHVSARLGISRRSLSRKLAEEGHSFRAVLAETRGRLAKYYLERTEISYGEVAFLLGYDETSSFFRAHRGWTGQTPQAARRAAQGR